MTLKGWMVFCLGVILGLTVASAAQQLLDAKRRSWSKRTAADCRTISDALERYRTDHGHYPPMDGDAEHLGVYLTPRYLRQFPARDMSNRPFLVVMNGAKAAVVSVGNDGSVVEAGHLIRGGPWLQ